MHLTAKETAYAIIFTITALAILLGTLIVWSLEQPNCWKLHASEEQAILNCEN
jgi:hypothetical protein